MNKLDLLWQASEGQRLWLLINTVFALLCLPGALRVQPFALLMFGLNAYFIFNYCVDIYERYQELSR